jgi:hypothetical protein
LIAFGHAAGEVMNYTPRQLAAFLTIATARRRRELAEQINIQALAARGDEKAMKATLKELSDDAR